ncbi:MAG: hypothetical protein Kow00121_48680 [Elainellaceae cyanobacterium]
MNSLKLGKKGIYLQQALLLSRSHYNASSCLYHNIKPFENFREFRLSVVIKLAIHKGRKAFKAERASLLTFNRRP